MIHLSDPYLSCSKIKQIAPQAQPQVGIILGSGLGGITKHIQNATTIAYKELPGFPNITVAGHTGALILGAIAGVPIVCLQGRMHAYEGVEANNAIKTYIRTLKLLGCNKVIMTNAAGSLNQDVGPGELLMVTDHINLQPNNPLVGPNDDDFGTRFYPLDKAYDPDIRSQFLQVAKQKNIKLHTGTYISVLGPHYETAAEIKAFRILGADAVGMSTVPEVLVANHCGMQVGVISMITNFATGLTTQSHNHLSVVETAERGSEKLSLLLTSWLQQYQTIKLRDSSLV